MDIKAVRSGKQVAGTMVRLVGEPALAALARHAGLDFIMLDMEHGSFTHAAAARVFLAARALGLGAFVRVPELTRGHVSRTLDGGAQGVMVPMIETVAQAQKLVQWAKYPPLGERGLSSGGGHTDWALTAGGTAFMAEQNAQTLAIAQIETRAAIEAVDDIAAVEGIDVLLIGPNDLAVSLGCADNMAVPEHEAAIRKTAAAARLHGKLFGIHGSLELLRRHAPDGLTFAMHSLDIQVLADGLRTVAEAMRAAVAPGKQGGP